MHRGLKKRYFPTVKFPSRLWYEYLHPFWGVVSSICRNEKLVWNCRYSRQFVLCTRCIGSVRCLKMEEFRFKIWLKVLPFSSRRGWSFIWKFFIKTHRLKTESYRRLYYWNLWMKILQMEQGRQKSLSTNIWTEEKLRLLSKSCSGSAPNKEFHSGELLG